MREGCFQECLQRQLCVTLQVSFSPEVSLTF